MPIFLYGRNYGRGDIKYMIQVFNYIAHFLDGQPGRKNVIWMSDNFPIRLFPSDDDGQAYQEEIKETLDLMTREQVAVYPVDTQGVVVDDPHAPAGAASGGGVTADYRSGGSPQPGNATGDGSLGNAGGTPGASRAAGGPGYSLLSSSYMTQDEMARVTGGRAYYSKNDLKDALAEATDNGATYYTFTYSPSNPNYNGKLRSIHVELAKHGYQLSYRHSYYADDPDAPPRPGKRDVARVTTDFHAPKDPLSASMEHGAPISHDLLFKAYLRAKGEPGLGTPEQMAAISQAGFLKEHRPGKPGKPVPPVNPHTYELDYTLLRRHLWITLGAGG